MQQKAFAFYSDPRLLLLPFFLRGGGSILLREVAEANLSYFVEARLYLRATRVSNLG